MLPFFKANVSGYLSMLLEGTKAVQNSECWLNMFMDIGFFFIVKYKFSIKNIHTVQCYTLVKCNTVLKAGLLPHLVSMG